MNSADPDLLPPPDQRFLDQRARLVRLWPMVGGALLLALAGLWLWLWLTVPLLVNPVAAVQAIEQGELAPSMAYLMAGMLPIAVTAALLQILVLLAFGTAWARREKRYQNLIHRLCGGGTAAPGPNAKEPTR